MTHYADRRTSESDVVIAKAEDHKWCLPLDSTRCLSLGLAPYCNGRKNAKNGNFGCILNEIFIFCKWTKFDFKTQHNFSQLSPKTLVKYLFSCSGAYQFSFD